MSAYLVSRGHIRYLVEAALHLDQEGLRHYWHDGRSHYVNELTADDLGLMLWTECAKSVGARYPNDGPDDLPGPIGDGPRFGYVHVPVWHHSPVPVAVLKAIRCYEYQTCEHAEWESSAAKAFCDALTHYAVSRLPGYDSAPWGCPPELEIDRPADTTPNVRRF